MPRLWITPEADLGRVLEREPDAFLLSFGSPTRPASCPAGHPFERFEAFAFNDIAEPTDGLRAPSLDDVERLLALVSGREPAPALVLQCWFGVSRSTAAAVIAATVLDPTRDHAARLRAIAPWATPNALMIAHADQALGLGGALVDAVRAIGRGLETDRGRAVILSPGTDR